MLISFALTYANLYCSTKFNLAIHMVGTLIHISSTKSLFFKATKSPLDEILYSFFNIIILQIRLIHINLCIYKVLNLKQNNIYLYL